MRRMEISEVDVDVSRLIFDTHSLLETFWMNVDGFVSDSFYLLTTQLTYLPVWTLSLPLSLPLSLSPFSLFDCNQI